MSHRPLSPRKLIIGYYYDKQTKTSHRSIKEILCSDDGQSQESFCLNQRKELSSLKEEIKSLKHQMKLFKCYIKNLQGEISATKIYRDLLSKYEEERSINAKLESYIENLEQKLKNQIFSKDSFPKQHSINFEHQLPYEESLTNPNQQSADVQNDKKRDSNKKVSFHESLQKQGEGEQHTEKVLHKYCFSPFHKSPKKDNSSQDFIPTSIQKGLKTSKVLTEIDSYSNGESKGKSLISKQKIDGLFSPQFKTKVTLFANDGQQPHECSRLKTRNQLNSNHGIEEFSNNDNLSIRSIIDKNEENVWFKDHIRNFSKEDSEQNNSSPAIGQLTEYKVTHHLEGIQQSDHQLRGDSMKESEYQRCDQRIILKGLKRLPSKESFRKNKAINS